MKINLIAVGENQPPWVQQGFETYVKRLPKDFHFKLIEVKASKYSKDKPLEQCMEQEGIRLLQAVPKHNVIISLDKGGNLCESLTFAQKLHHYYQESQAISFLIGGPQGLSTSCLAACNESWSLSQLTFPHGLVRILIAEQLYRAWTILFHHPYHR